MAGRCIVFDRRSDPMVMESRIVSAPFPISTSNRLVASAVYLAFAFSSRRSCHIDSYPRFLHRVEKTNCFEKSRPIENNNRANFSSIFSFSFFFLREITRTYYYIGMDGNSARWKNVMRSVLSTSKRERRQEICGGDGGGNVTPRLHGPRQGDSNFRVHVGSVKRRAARFAST